MTQKRVILALFALVVVIAGCAGPQKKEAKKPPNNEPVEVNAEALMLLKNLEENGDYVNSRNFPSLIKASVVYQELGGLNHIIDLRSAGEYAQGHIRGAVNVPFEGLPEYLETKIKPFEYGKIILVCATGQVSGYAVSLLRLMGYGNTFAMRYGMASWNRRFAEETWLKNISSAYESRLDTSTLFPGSPSDLPVPQTGKNTGEEIRTERFRKLMADGSQIALITAREVFDNPGNFYLINFERKDKYESGHIPGAVRYKQNGTLGILQEMETIPAGKTVVIYCGTGHNSAFATGYLRMFGYDAKTLLYGNNAFMHGKMVKDKVTLSWGPFTEEDINNFETVR